VSFCGWHASAALLTALFSYDQADSTYKLGIARSAEPVDRIRRKYREFQARVTASTAMDAAAGEAPPFRAILAAAMASADRSTLGERVQSNGRSAGVGPSRSANVVRGLGGNAGLAGSRLMPAQNNGRKLDVFRDDDIVSAGGGPAGWDELGSQAVRGQEATGSTARPWKGEVLPQRAPKRPLAMPTPSRDEGRALAVFKDSDEEDTPPRKAAVAKGLFAESEEDKAAQRLRDDPLAFYGADTKRSLTEAEVRAARGAARSAVPSRSRREAAPAAAASKAPTGKREERLKLPVHMMYRLAHVDAYSTPPAGVDAGEMSVEELIALQRGIELDVHKDPWAHLNDFIGVWLPRPLEEPEVEQDAFDDDVEMEVDETQESLQTAGPASPPAVAQAVYDSPEAKRPASPPAAPSPRAAPPPSAFAAEEDSDEEPAPRVRRQGGRRMGEPTVTMVTAAALAEVNGYFNEDESSDSDDSTDEDDEDEDELLPLAHRAPASMLSGSRDVPPTPTPMARHVPAPAMQALAPAAAPEQVAAPQPSFAPAAVPATPAKSAFGASSGAVRKPLAAVPRLETEIAASRAQRVDPGAFAEEDEESESDGEAEAELDGNGNPLHEHMFHNLTRVTEVTEMTRFTMANRTPGHTTSRTRDSRRSQIDSRILEAAEDSVLREQVGGDMLLLDRSAAAPADIDRSWASSSGQEGEGELSGSLDWDRQKSDLSKGYTIARAADDQTGRLGHQRLGETLILKEDEDEDSISVVQPASPALQAAAIPNPCSPCDPDVISAILAGLELPLESSPDFVDLSSQPAEGRLAALRKRSKAHMRRSTASSGASSSTKEWKVDIDGHPFLVRALLGEGGFGSVFLAEDVTGCAPPKRKAIGGVMGDSSFSNGLADLSIDSEAEEDEEEAERKRLVAVKVESPPNRWEFYILGQLRARLDAATLSSIISARRFYTYADESFLLLEYAEKGTLLDVVNTAASAGVASASLAAGGSGGGQTGVDEVLAIFFTIELMRLVDALHSAGFIHGDLKIDNCLLRLDEAPSGQTWSNAYARDGSAGWASKGITLIDFGRAIDVTRMPAGQGFVADWNADERDCPEMREGRAWTYQPDYFGVASVAYCLLFGRYIETAATTGEDGRTRYRIAQPLRRYWQVDLWGRLFDVLLNPVSVRADGALPITDELREIRADMEDWLEINCGKGGRHLKGSLRKLEVAAMARSLA
jgi:checkpoint serine/threonine-protein kinase